MPTPFATSTPDGGPPSQTPSPTPTVEIPLAALDASFGEAGIVDVEVPEDVVPRVVLVDSRGRIVLVAARRAYIDQELMVHGGGGLVLLRLLEGGRVDRTFGENGVAILPEAGGSVVKAAAVDLADGILAVGASLFGYPSFDLCCGWVVRTDEDGRLLAPPIRDGLSADGLSATPPGLEDHVDFVSIDRRGRIDRDYGVRGVAEPFVVLEGSVGFGGDAEHGVTATGAVPGSIGFPSLHDFVSVSWDRNGFMTNVSAPSHTAGLEAGSSSTTELANLLPGVTFSVHIPLRRGAVVVGAREDGSGVVASLGDDGEPLAREDWVVSLPNDDQRTRASGDSAYLEFTTRLPQAVLEDDARLIVALARRDPPAIRVIRLPLPATAARR